MGVSDDIEKYGIPFDLIERYVSMVGGPDEYCAEQEALIRRLSSDRQLSRDARILRINQAMARIDFVSQRDVIDVFLDSCTVFHEEMGVAESDYPRAAEKWADIEEWLNLNCASAFRPWNKGVWFAASRDAVLYKLFWAGAML